MAGLIRAAAGVISAATTVSDAVGVIGAVGEIAPTHRQCSIEIMNETKDFSLGNPR